ncbi:hypothetical protein [Pandoraea communis]|uniref:hypothetical protein n=1 Tax=Pandoraea communis TaxID=2508297 RepID=UPI0025A4E0C8|nr:hypothetical protein [Pandoraea communis]MDM8359661.1 hypothetical protein [Pandoraea communis]
MEVLIKMPSDFPAQEILEIAKSLEAADVLVADYPDSNSEVYLFEHYLYDRLVEGVQTVLLPDRNIVSRVAQVARGEPLDGQRKKAAAVLAFAQCLDIQVEPSIAFHELAFSQGNSAALNELAWFRAADNSAHQRWIAAGLGRTGNTVPLASPLPTEYFDLAKPLVRWRRNYIAALKMGELELNANLSPFEKVSTLLEWMRDDFILAGPAAVLAFLYFAPNSPPRRGLLKSLRSDDRQAALAGAKNAAWDITYLSDFAQRINEAGESPSTRYILATLDQRLRDLARFVIGEHHEIDAYDSLALSFERWWAPRDARKIADFWSSCRTRTRSAAWWEQYKDRPNYVGELIAHGEHVLLNWHPGATSIGRVHAPI